MRRFTETITPRFVILVAAGLALMFAFSVIMVVVYSGKASQNGRLTANVPSLSRTNGMPRYNLDGTSDAGPDLELEKLPDFVSISDIKTRKLRFFSYLLPMVERENNRLLDIRNRLAYIHDQIRFNREPEEEDVVWIANLVAEFRLPHSDPHQPGFWQSAMMRIDRIPFQLVLAQAANESAWGTSRFAREGNNLFGQWCFKAGCGIIPIRRPTGAIYEVARFDSISESISSYMRNLNTGDTYLGFRRMRAQMRDRGQHADAMVLASGLIQYSERRQDYVDEIRTMIRQNKSVMAEARFLGENN